MPYIHSITHQKEQNFLYKMNYCFTHNRPYLIHIFLYCVVIFFFFFLYSLFPNTVDCFVIHILCQLHHCTYTSIDTPYRKLLITWKRSGSVGSSTGKLQTTVRCTCVETVPRPPTTIILHLAWWWKNRTASAGKRGIVPDVTLYDWSKTLSDGECSKSSVDDIKLWLWQLVLIQYHNVEFILNYHEFTLVIMMIRSQIIDYRDV